MKNGKRKAHVSSKRWRRETVQRGKQSRSVWWCEIKGARPGPSLGVVAGQHGMEPTGPAFLAAFLDALDPALLSGTLRVAPMANADALRGGFECALPPRQLKAAGRQGIKFGACPLGLNRNTCGRNMNRLWPGNHKGSLTERLVAVLWDRIVSVSDCVIDFHCWSDAGPPGVIFYDEEGMQAGRYFGLPHLFEYPIEDDPPGILTIANTRAGRATFTVELTPQNVVTAAGAEVGRAGLRNVMRHLGMLRGKAELPKRQFVTGYGKRDYHRIRVPWDAIVMPCDAPGGWYRKGERVGTMVHLDRPQVVRPINAPFDGVLGNAGGPRCVVRKGGAAFTFLRAKRLPPE